MAALILPGQFASWQNGLVHAVWQGKELSEFSSVNGFAKTVTPSGEAIRLTGTQYLLQRLPAGFNFPLTFVSVFRRNVASASRVLASVGSGTQRHLLYFASGNALQLYSAAGASVASLNSSTVSEAVNVHFAVGRVEGASSRSIYIDGTFYGPNTATANTTPMNVHAIGAYWNNDAPAAGFTSDADILFSGLWNRALSNAEILDLHQSWRRITRPAQRRVWVPTISGGLTQLLSSQELNFKLRDSLSSQLASVFKVRMFAENSLTHNYSVLNGVFKQQSVDYNLRGLITDNVELSYIIKGIVQDNLTSSYNIRSSVQDSSFIDYKVRSTCVTSEVLSYSLRTLISLDSVFSYNINTSGQIQSSRLIQYKIRSNIHESTGFSWYIRSIETTPSGLIYNIKGNIQGSSEGFSYKIYNSASSNQEFHYKIKGLLSKEVLFSYNTLGAVKLKKDFPLLFNILNAVQPNWTDVYIKSDSIHDVSVKSENTFVVFLK